MQRKIGSYIGGSAVVALFSWVPIGFCVLLPTVTMSFVEWVLMTLFVGFLCYSIIGSGKTWSEENPPPDDRAYCRHCQYWQMTSWMPDDGWADWGCVKKVSSKIVVEATPETPRHDGVEYYYVKPEVDNKNNDCKHFAKKPPYNPWPRVVGHVIWVSACVTALLKVGG